VADTSLAQLLASLHRGVIEALLAKVNSGDATAADLNVARALLRDNNISTDPSDLSESEVALAKALEGLSMELPQ